MMNFQKNLLNSKSFTLYFAEAMRKQDQKFDDIEQVLTYLIQKDNQQTQQSNRKEVGYKN